MGLRMKPVLTSDEKKKVKIISRLNLSLVTVTNDKFFFFKMTSEFLFQEMNYIIWNNICYVYSITAIHRMGRGKSVPCMGIQVHGRCDKGDTSVNRGWG